MTRLVALFVALVASLRVQAFDVFSEQQILENQYQNNELVYESGPNE